MQPAIGLVETNSIAIGIRVGDAMVKRAPVNLLESRTVCPGKYIVLVGVMLSSIGSSYRTCTSRCFRLLPAQWRWKRSKLWA